MEAPLILSIETSGKTGGVALFKGTLLGEINFSSRESYSKILFSYLPVLLQKTNISLRDINFLAVDIGPGSFTGLRIGLSLAKALCLVYSTPVLALSSLEVLAFRFFYSPLPILSIVDAYTGEIFFAIYKFEGNRLVNVTEPRLSKLGDIKQCIDSGVIIATETPEKWKSHLTEILGHRAIFPPFAVSLKASQLAELASFKLNVGEINPVDGAEVLPLYLKSSEAERKKCFAIS